MAAVARCFIFLVFLIGLVQGRILSQSSSDDHLISDRVENLGPSVKTSTNSGLSTTKSCTHKYGFLPCAENTAGHIFLILMYLLLLVFGESQIGSGSEVLFHIMRAKTIGSIIYCLLMSLPAKIMLIASGIFSTKETAQSQVSVGIGIYAGMTVYSLTIQWGMCVIYARVSDSKQKSDDNGEKKHSKCSQAKEKLMILKGSVEVDEHTSRTAGIVLLSLIPYAIVQLAHVLNTSSGKRIITLISLIVSSLSLISYLAYQIWKPSMEQLFLAHFSGILQGKLLDYLRQQGQLMNEDGKPIQLVNEDGKPNTDVIKKVFADRDTDHDGHITEDELKILVDKITNNGPKEIYTELDISRVIEIFDFDNNRCINEEEFTKKCKRWIETDHKLSSRSIFHEALWKISACGKRAFIKSVLQLLLGIVILFFVGGPLTSSIRELSYAMKLPSFTISFVAVPCFMNLRVAIAALLPASQKSKKTASSTFSEIYGTVIMNNLTGLTALLVIIFAKDLPWDFSAEVLTILVVCAVMGILAYSSTIYPVWTCILAFALYPFSLGFFYIAKVLLSWN